MWARVNAASVQQENAVSVMQIDMMQLGVLQTQLDNLSMQATLIIGFALGMWSGETLEPLVDDESNRCVFKTSVHRAIALAFFLCVAGCIGCCFIVVTLCSYVKQASQLAALMISTSASVANTSRHLRLVYDIFVIAVLLFILSATLLIWLFVGLPDRIPFHGNPHGGVHETLKELDTGGFVITCIDVTSHEQNAMRDQYSFLVATMNTALILSMGLLGYLKFRQVLRTYDQHALMEWYHEHMQEMEENSSKLHAEESCSMFGNQTLPNSIDTDTYHVYESDQDSTN